MPLTECQEKQERWQVFLPATRRSLERLEALAGVRLAEEPAEAIWSEKARISETHFQSLQLEPL